MMKKYTLVALLALIPLSAQAEIFRCVSNGHTVFQDFPCEGAPSERVNANTINIMTAPTYQPPRPPTSQPQSSNRSNNRNHQTWTNRRNAETRSRPSLVRGMSRQRVFDVYGSPNSRSTVMRNGQACERLTWHSPRSYSGTITAIICDQKIYSVYGPHR